jgi:hypothetical protein
MVRTFRHSPMHRFCESVAELLIARFGFVSIEKEWETMGFIASSDHFDTVLGIDETADLVGVLPPDISVTTHQLLSNREVRLRVLTSASSAFKEKSEPKDYFKAHDILVKLDNWDSIRDAMNAEADDIRSEIPKAGHLKMSLAVRVGSRKIKIKCPEVIRKGIARRVVLKWALLERDEHLTGQKLGFGTNVKGQSTKQIAKRRKAVENFEKYLKIWQLKDMNFNDPENSVTFTTEERDYVFSHLE